MHYPNTIRSHLVTIVPIAPFTPKSTLKLRSALHIRYVCTIHSKVRRAYRPYHNTETATVKIFSDICLSLSQSRDVVLWLLDLRSAFDTLQHEILIQCLADIGVRNKALEWFRSYLVYRTTSVKVNLVKYGVPQGSVLGPKLYTADH